MLARMSQQSKLGPYLLSSKDSVRFYPLCATCVEKVETIGGPLPREQQVFII